MVRTSRIWFFSKILNFLPPTRFFKLKRIIYGYAGLDIESNVRISSNIKILIGGDVSIGENTWVGHGFLLTGGDALVQIGKNCDIGPNVSIVTGTHVIDYVGDHVAGQGYSLPVTIGNGCWICTSAVILGGTVIGEKSIVAAGAVVRGTYPPKSLIGGVPAVVIKKL